MSRCFFFYLRMVNARTDAVGFVKIIYELSFQVATCHGHVALPHLGRHCHSHVILSESGYNWDFTFRMITSVVAEISTESPNRDCSQLWKQVLKKYKWDFKFSGFLLVHFQAPITSILWPQLFPLQRVTDAKFTITIKNVRWCQRSKLLQMRVAASKQLQRT
jgi:hypothetical protein